jgi:protease-4
MGTPGKPMTDEQKAILQAFIDEYYNQFVEIVAEGRNMKVEDVKKLADGRIYTASQAVDNGLIDGIKTAEEFDAYVKEQSGTDVFYEPSSDSNPFSKFFGSIANISQPKSDTEILLDLAHSLENGGPMYYANPLGQ